MELVYFFCEPALMRVPFFGFDQRLFGLLAAAGGGVWDNLRQEFVFRLNESTDVFDCSSFGIPCVKVDETAAVPVSVSGFLERPWEGDCPERGAVGIPAGIPAVTQVVNKHGRKPLSPAFSAPEKLSEYWLVKLETELRARKFSTQTRNSYIYYAQTLCRALQKTPEEILPGDVKQFLAIMERAGYSAAAMNLALSSIKFFFSNVLNNNGVREQRRPRQDKKLPIVFSKDEIKKNIAMERNPKHRLLMMLVYSSGLRVSEAVAIKREHIDLSRKVVYIIFLKTVRTSAISKCSSVTPVSGPPNATPMFPAETFSASKARLTPFYD